MISKIKSIKKVDCNSKRYDLQSSTENFFANGMLVHNSLLSLAWDGEKYCVSTRKLAFAEGQTNLGRTFAEVFKSAAEKTDLGKIIYAEPLEDSVRSQFHWMKDFTLVFELTGPENRVVTRYPDSKITLIGGRHNKNDYRELSSTELDNIAFTLKIDRPHVYHCSSYDELLKLVKEFPTMQEGVVLVIENENGSHWRIKCKNPQFVAIAHMRENGNISPKRILTLVMVNEHYEYLKYFPEDEKYFNFVEAEYAEAKNRISTIYKEHMGIKEQKEFALTIMPKTMYSFEKGIIFTLRKSGGTIEEHLNSIGAKKIALGMNLKKKFIDKFHVTVEEEEGEESK